jgi:pimeloyl-ACP methyl ester carboxylesterase
VSLVPIVFVPGLLGSPRLYAEQLPAMWRFGPVTVASHRHGDSMAAIADGVLATAAPEFALVGLSMGGYVAFEIMRRAAHRVTRLALLDTTARPDSAEHTRRREDQIALSRNGGFFEVVEALFRLWVRTERHDDAPLRRVIHQMADETGPDAFVRQQIAIMNRPDSRPGLAEIDCPTLVVVGADDGVTTPEHAAEIVDRVPGARLVVVPDCGHLSTLEQPAVVTRTLVDWLGG